MAPISSTPRPRGAPYHSPNTAPARAAGAARRSPSTTDGQHAGSCTVHTRFSGDMPSAVATSWAAAGAAPRPTVVETKTKKNTASAATATGPRSRPRITSRHGATATHGAALAMAARRVMLRRRAGIVPASNASTKATTDPITSPRKASQAVAFVARRYTSWELPTIGRTASAGVTTIPRAQPARPPTIHTTAMIATPLRVVAVRPSRRSRARQTASAGADALAGAWKVVAGAVTPAPRRRPGPRSRPAPGASRR